MCEDHIFMSFFSFGTTTAIRKSPSFSFQWDYCIFFSSSFSIAQVSSLFGFGHRRYVLILQAHIILPALSSARIDSVDTGARSISSISLQTMLSYVILAPSSVSLKLCAKAFHSLAQNTQIWDATCGTVVPSYQQVRWGPLSEIQNSGYGTSIRRHPPYTHSGAQLSRSLKFSVTPTVKSRYPCWN